MVLTLVYELFSMDQQTLLSVLSAHADGLQRYAHVLHLLAESRTLDQHIANLRKRIERDPAAPEIVESVRGVGYRFRA